MTDDPWISIADRTPDDSEDDKPEGDIKQATCPKCDKVFRLAQGNLDGSHKPQVETIEICGDPTYGLYVAIRCPHCQYRELI